MRGAGGRVAGEECAQAAAPWFNEWLTHAILVEVQLLLLPERFEGSRLGVVVCECGGVRVWWCSSGGMRVVVREWCAANGVR